MTIYEQIAERTNGDIYVGVVGPVRTGKSTFITKFMEKIVLPKIKNGSLKERTKDELPQSGAGKLIMTMQPRFVPSEAVEVEFSDNAKAKIRLVDCVGYLIDGAQGHEENGTPRLVKTPWNEEAIPFEQAAEIGTSKVITEHSTIGIVVTTDGTITDLPRHNYLQAERRVIAELKEQDKPYVVVLNTKKPTAEETDRLKKSMEAEYAVPVVVSDLENISEEDLINLLEKVLFEFPVKQVNFKFPNWMRSLPKDNEIVSYLLEKVSNASYNKMSDYLKNVNCFDDNNDIENPYVEEINLATGVINYVVNVASNLFYKTLSNLSGTTITDDFELINYITTASVRSNAYKKLENALASASQTGYGIVVPTSEDLTLGEPEMIKKSTGSGIKLKAVASSYHIVKVPVEAEVTPAVNGYNIGGENAMTEEDKSAIWNTNMFGKSLVELAHDGIVAKVNNFPAEAQQKMQKTLGKITNEGRGGIICILL